MLAEVMAPKQVIEKACLCVFGVAREAPGPRDEAPGPRDSRLGSGRRDEDNLVDGVAGAVSSRVVSLRLV